MTSTVTGRTYTATRPRGLAAWKPQAKTRVLLEHVDEVLAEYEDHLPLTARQVFYRLIGAYGFVKAEQAYERLCETLNRARRAQLVAWDAIRDDGTQAVHPAGFDGLPGFWAAVRATAAIYRLDPSIGQPFAVEVWVEAAGMVPQVARVADEYGVPVFSSGGFDSVTAKHEAAVRFMDRSRPTVVLHVGDYDPSGCAIIDSLADDIATFAADYGRPGIVEFQRVAVTPEQIATYELPTAPQKPRDRRGAEMRETVQAEALAPDELATEIRTALDRVHDLDLLAERRDRGNEERAELLAQVRDLTIDDETTDRRTDHDRH